MVRVVNGLLGVSVAVLLVASEVTAAGTRILAASRSSKVALVMLAGSIGSLKLAVTTDPIPTSLAPSAGAVPATVGATVSGTLLVSKTTSTQ